MYHWPAVVNGVAVSTPPPAITRLPVGFVPDPFSHVSEPDPERVTGEVLLLMNVNTQLTGGVALSVKVCEAPPLKIIALPQSAATETSVVVNVRTGRVLPPLAAGLAQIGEALAP